MAKHKIEREIEILGEIYTIKIEKISQNRVMKENNWSGFCDDNVKKIVIADTKEEEFFPYLTAEEQESLLKKILKHEIIHAFLSESGLAESSIFYGNGWATNEEMVDWIAIQTPKIMKVWEELGCF